ncbi:MAG: hypothetical protein ACTHJ1_09300 [Bordetella sp.]|uniref:hypothetical protein n=1 Tax=Bordetella sp. TaxID=28081 RepID=UPI003F7C6920
MADYLDAIRQMDAGGDEPGGSTGLPDQQSPQQSPDPYLGAVQQMASETQASATDTLLAAQQSKPDAAGRAMTLAPQVGVPAPAVEADLPTYEQQAQLQKSRQIMAQNPVLAQWVAANPMAARVAQDDFDKLDLLSKLSTALKTGADSALAQNQLGRLYSDKALGGTGMTATPSSQDLASAEQNAAQAQTLQLHGLMGGVQQVGGFVAGMFDNFLHARTQLESGAAMGATIGAATGMEFGGVGALPGAAAGAMTGGALGFGLGWKADMARVQYGLTYRALDQMQDQAGNPLSETAKQAGAALSGALTFGLAQAGGVATSRVTQAAVQPFVADAVSQAMARPTVQAALRNFTVAAARGGLEGAALNAGMEAASIAGEELGKQVSPGQFNTVFNDPQTRQAAITRLADAAESGALLFGGMHMAGASLGLGGDMLRVRQAQADMQTFQGLQDGAAQSATRDRNLQAFQSFMQSQLGGSPAENLYVPAERIAQVYQQHGVEPGAGDPLFGFVPDMAKQLEQAGPLGGDVVIPTADYLTHMAGTDVSRELLPDIRVRQDGMSYRESRDHLASQQQAMVDTAAKLVADKQTPDVRENQLQQIHDDVARQLDSAGVTSPDVNQSYAAMHQAFYDTTSARLGISPAELYNRVKPNIRGLADSAPDGTQYDQAAKQFGGSLPDLAKALTEDRKNNAYFVPIDSPTADSAARILDATGIDVVGGRALSYGSDVISDLREHPDLGADDWQQAASMINNFDQAGRSIAQRGTQGERVTLTKDLGNGESHGAVFEVLNGRPGRRLVLKSFVRDKTSKVNNWFESNTREKLDSGFMRAGGDSRLPNNAGGANADHPGIQADSVGQGGEDLNQDARGTFGPATNTISLLEKADLSTFLHESGHFFLNTLRDIAARADAPDSIRQDMASLGEWYRGNAGDVAGEASKYAGQDVTPDHVHAYLDNGTTGDAARDAAIDRAQHEQFARGFEKYLFEGHAPTAEIQGLFSRFRSWLLNVYDALSRLGVNLTPEVRGVFDRMLASDQAIADAERVRGYKALFDSPEAAEAAGMSREAYEAYRQDDQAATAEAQNELQARSLRNMQWFANAKAGEIARLQKEAAAARKDVKAEVTKQIEAEPIERARAWLKKGEMTADNGEQVKADKGFRLNTDDLKAMYPDSMLARPDLTNLRGLTARDGLHPDLVAEMFGLPSGDAMVRELVDGESRQSKIEGLTDAIMLERHGDLTDPQSMERAAEAAIHNDMRARVLAAEFKALGKMTGSARDLSRAAEEAARVAIAAKKVGDLRPAQYRAAEARAGRAAQEALARGDTMEAAAQKRAQLLNNRLFKESTDAVTEAQKIVRDQQRFDKAGIRKKMDPDILDQIDALRERFDFRQNPPDGPSKEHVSLQTWVDSQKTAYYSPYQHPDMMNERFRAHYKNLTMEQLRGFHDTVGSMETVARDRKQVTVDGRKLATDAVVDDLVAKMKERGEQFKLEDQLQLPSRDRGDPLWRVALDRSASLIRTLGAELKTQSHKANYYDRHEVLGPFARTIFNRVMDASYRKNDMLRALSSEFGRIADSLGREWQDSLAQKVTNTRLLDDQLTEKYRRPVYRDLTRGDMLGIARHVGNESNFDKLTKGMQWEPEAVWRFLGENMTPKDWQATQATWDAFEKFWPDMVEMNRRLGNTSPDRIEPRAFTTPDGIEMRGGYAPIDYDPLRSRFGEKESGANAIDPGNGLLGTAYFRADTTTNGSLNARTGYNDRIDLGYHSVEKRLHDTIHDLAYREALLDVNKILSNRRFRDAFNATYGREQYKELQKWVGGIANSPNMDPKASVLTKIMESTRHAMVANGIAFRVSTILKHGGSAGAKSVGYFSGGGGKYLAARAARMVTDHAGQIRSAIEKFPEIRARAMQQDRDYKEAVSSLFHPESRRGKAERYGHSIVAFADLCSAVPTAWAAYDRAITEGVPVNRGGTGRPMSEADAVAYANQIVREAHGGNTEAARSNIMQNRNEAVKMMTTLYGFMNNSYGQMTDMADKLRTYGFSKPEVLARFMAAAIVPALVAGWVEGKDEAEGWGAWVAKAIGGEIASTVPMLREAVGMLKGYSNVGLPSLMQTLAAIKKPFQDVYEAAQGKPTHAPIKDAGNALGLMVPGLGQLSASLQGAHDIAAGTYQPQGLGDAARAVLMGQEHR